MKRFFAHFFCFCSFFSLNAGPASFSLDYFESFYNSYMCGEKNFLSKAGLSSSCSIGSFPTPPLATPPPDPAPPPFMAGRLPVVLVNNSGLPDTEVFILVQGRVPTNGPQVFVHFDGSGVGTNTVVSAGDNGSNYTLPLSSFPVSGNGHVFYLEQIDSALVFISMDHDLNIPVLATGIADPAFNNPNDPYGNYNTIWDQVELAYVNTTPNIAVDATAVSFFSLPLYCFLSTPAPGSGSNCGLSQTRSTLMSYFQEVYAAVPPPPESGQWSNLILRNGSTVLRMLSPGKAMAAGFFDDDYSDDRAAYGYSYLFDVWSGPNSFYRRNTLSIEIPGGAIYSGKVQSDNSLLLTWNGNVVRFGAPATGPDYLSSTSYQIFSGVNLTSSATIPADGIQVSKAFEEAVIAGIVPTTQLINASTLNTLSVFRPYYQIDTNLSADGQGSGPWYDLYSRSLHACGLIYSFAYDEPLWPEVLLQSDTLVPNSTYIGITIGNSQ